jgi:hypothetical protein
VLGAAQVPQTRENLSTAFLRAPPVSVSPSSGNRPNRRGARESPLGGRGATLEHQTSQAPKATRTWPRSEPRACRVARLPSPSPWASQPPMAEKRDGWCQSRAMAKQNRPPASTAHRPLPREPQANHFLEANTPGVKRVARGGGAPSLRDGCAPLRAHSDSCEGRIFGDLGRSPRCGRSRGGGDPSLTGHPEGQG